MKISLPSKLHRYLRQQLLPSLLHFGLTLGATAMIAGATATIAAPAMLAQQTGISPMPHTVSVAMLQVPLKARAHFEKARQAAIAGREDEYTREIDAAIAIDPSFSEAFVLRASHEVTRQHYDDAIADARFAQRLEPGIPWAAIVRASACNGLKRYDEAAALLGALPPAEAATWQAVYEMARAQIGRGDSEAALRATALALTAVPATQADSAHLLRGNALQMAHRFTEAAAQLQAYLDSPRPQPQRTAVLLLLAQTQTLAHEQEVAGVASPSPLSKALTDAP